LRTFAIAAAESFQIADWRPGIEKYFIPDKEIVMFESADELRDKSKHYLSDVAGRLRIAHAARERVQREHTYAHRFAQILAAADLLPAETRKFGDFNSNLSHLQ
jgi:spore maturation protein CgeB